MFDDGGLILLIVLAVGVIGAAVALFTRKGSGIGSHPRNDHRR